MNELQEIFDSTLNETIEKGINHFLCENIKKKFSEQGVDLDDNKVLEIVKKLREGETEQLHIDIDDGNETVKNLNIDLTDLDFKNITDKLLKGLEKAYPNIIKDLSEILFKQLKSQAFADVKQFRTDQLLFQSELERFWRKPFILFEIYLALIFEMGFKCNEQYRKTCAQKPDIVFDVLMKLHGRASQIGLEVLTLMKAGFADGAHARWRTLHEIAAVALFIEKYGKEVAERYVSHNDVESYKAALQYQQYAKFLKQKEISTKELAKIKGRRDKAINKYGTNFKNSYGWASFALKKDNPTFSDIEADVGLDSWRPYYKLASHNVHANPKGIVFKMGLSGKSKNIILAGASDYGFTDPAHGTAISLLQITSTFLFNPPNIDRLVIAEVLRKFEQLIGEEFLKIQKKYETKYFK